MPIIFDNTDSSNKEVFSAKRVGNKVLVRFTNNGKEYSYSDQRIKVIKEADSGSAEADNLVIPLYALDHNCWKCGYSIQIPTYINYESHLEPLKFPWDRVRLNKEKSDTEQLLHVFTDAGIEYYPVSVVGQNPGLDQLLAEQNPVLVDKAKMRKRETSRMPGYPYLAAHCPRCKVVQGWFPSVYYQINRVISVDEELPIVGSVELKRDSINSIGPGNTVEELWSYIPTS
ncbi:MAG: hypothetical protein LBD25_00180 [Coriobacteriales bacterium]|jgi:hypothetical protein|nr:hypothetical protein [Coriobacteriales bacterium]